MSASKPCEFVMKSGTHAWRLQDDASQVQDVSQVQVECEDLWEKYWGGQHAPAPGSDSSQTSDATTSASTSP